VFKVRRQPSFWQPTTAFDLRASTVVTGMVRPSPRKKAAPKPKKAVAGKQAIGVGRAQGHDACAPLLKLNLPLSFNVQFRRKPKRPKSRTARQTLFRITHLKLVQTGQLMPAQVLRVSSEFSRLRLLRATCRQVTTVVTGAAAPVRIAAVAAPKKLTVTQKKKDDDARKKKEEDEAAAQAVMEEWAENRGCSQSAEFEDLERSAVQIR
jgi:hypothetical protein